MSQQPVPTPPAAPAPVPTPPPAAPAPTPPAAPAPTPPAGDGKQPPWGKPENFDADKAWELIENLRKEKGAPADPGLKDQVDQLRASQQQTRDALAAALGVKPEETSDVDKLSQQIETMRAEILTSKKEALSATTGVPVALLTATDAEGLQKQATELAAFAQAAHYAAATATPATPPPAFQQNPGQGQGHGAPNQAELDAAEYEKYFPAAKK